MYKAYYSKIHKKHRNFSEIGGYLLYRKESQAENHRDAFERNET